MERGNYFLVMDLLGPNLQELMKLCGGKFSLDTSIVLAIQMVKSVSHSSKEFSFCMVKDFFAGISNQKILWWAAVPDPLSFIWSILAWVEDFEMTRVDCIGLISRIETLTVHKDMQVLVHTWGLSKVGGMILSQFAMCWFISWREVFPGRTIAIKPPSIPNKSGFWKRKWRRAHRLYVKVFQLK